VIAVCGSNYNQLQAIESDNAEAYNAPNKRRSAESGNDIETRSRDEKDIWSVTFDDSRTKKFEWTAWGGSRSIDKFPKGIWDGPRGMKQFRRLLRPLLRPAPPTSRIFLCLATVIWNALLCPLLPPLPPTSRIFLCLATVIWIVRAGVIIPIRGYPSGYIGTCGWPRAAFFPYLHSRSLLL